MQVRNGDVWTATTGPAGLPTPMQTLLAVGFPVKTSYWLARLARKLDGPRKDIDAVRVGLVKQHGKTDDKGQTIITPNDEHWKDFEAAYEELMEQTVEIDIQPVVLPEKKSDGTLYEVKGETLWACDPFVSVEGA